jgi:hypothetical protein
VIGWHFTNVKRAPNKNKTATSLSSFFVPRSDAESLHESVQVVILKDQRSRFLGPSRNCAGDFSSNEGSAPPEQQVVVFMDSSTYAVRQCEAARDTGRFAHRRAAEFLKIAQAFEIEFVQVLADWTMNHVKHRVAKDMSAASELVRA